jgi:hypothetical protein
MAELKQQALEVLNNLNWLIEAHDSYVEFIDTKDNKVVIRCVGPCADCDDDCVGVAFKERMPQVELLRL